MVPALFPEYTEEKNDTLRPYTQRYERTALRKRHAVGTTSGTRRRGRPRRRWTGFLLKIATPPLFHPNFGVFPLD